MHHMEVVDILNKIVCHIIIDNIIFTIIRINTGKFNLHKIGNL